MTIIEADMATFGPYIKMKCIKLKWKEAVKDSQQCKSFNF